jgi:hypothetical protein
MYKICAQFVGKNSQLMFSRRRAKYEALFFLLLLLLLPDPSLLH